MNGTVTPGPKSRSTLSARRLALLAGTILSLGAVALLVTPGSAPQNNLPTLSTFANAQNLTKEAQTVARPVGFADIVEKVKPAVVSVRVKRAGGTQLSSNNNQELPFPPGSQLDRFFREFGMPNMPNAPRGNNQSPQSPRGGGGQFVTGQGSGFIISADGYAVTNNHVVDKADTVEVVTDEGKTYTAKVIGTDERTDLALIKLEGNFPYVKLSDGSPRIGDWVLAIGNPFGLGGTVTAGIVSARGRDINAGPYDDFIQIDAPVNKGNSGGPTFDVDGNVIGVNTAIFSPSGGSVGIAFAIPAETVKTVVAQLKEHGAVTRGWIGVAIQPVTKDIADSLGLKQEGGALVSEPQANSPAAKAGVEAGDVITSVNGAPVKDARDLAKKIGAIAPGTSVKLGVVRQGAEKSMTMTLGELPKQREARANTNEPAAKKGDPGPLGLTLAPASTVAGSGQQGVVVTEVDPSSVAAEHGFRTGDVILEVAGKAVAKPDEVNQALTDARSGGKRVVLMRVKSGEATKFVAVTLSRA